jgi:hypothetical protein
VIISKRNHHLTASDITLEINQSLPMYASCIQRSRMWIQRSRGLFPIAELSNVDDFYILQTKFSLILNAEKWFLVGNSAEKIGLIEAMFTVGTRSVNLHLENNRHLGFLFNNTSRLFKLMLYSIQGLRTVEILGFSRIF